MTTADPLIESLVRLTEKLKALGRNREALNRALCVARLSERDASRYLHFRETFYTRNLICRTEDFELLALCWEPGQITPIHDHADSEGWMYGLAGEVEEVRYRCETPEGGPARVTRIEDGRVGVGKVAHINDDIAWHTVGNPTGERAVSLHLYSPPIDSCRWYDTDSATVKTRTLEYYSVDGVTGRGELRPGAGPRRRKPSAELEM